jgi:nitrogen fixation NifU-like protein
MDDLYREVIIEHYKNPGYKGTLDPHDISFEDENPLCGDHIRIDLRVKDGRVTEAAFSGHGCAISQASADLLLESVIGKTLDEVKEIGKQDVLDNLGIETLGPVRIKCALLSLKVLKAGVYGLGEASDKLVEE